MTSPWGAPVPIELPERIEVPEGDDLFPYLHRTMREKFRDDPVKLRVVNMMIDNATRKTPWMATFPAS